MEHDEEHAIVNMDGKCAPGSGLGAHGPESRREVDYLCQITGYGDFGQCEGPGTEGRVAADQRPASAAPTVLKITKLNGGKPAIETSAASAVRFRASSSWHPGPAADCLDHTGNGEG